MRARIPEAAHRLFDERTFAHVATLMPDGAPQTTPMWVERDDDTILLNTAKGRVKANNLARDPRIALSILDPKTGYNYVQVRGRATLVEEGAREHIEKLSRKYLGRPYPSFGPGEERLIVRVTPEQVDYRGR